MPSSNPTAKGSSPPAEQRQARSLSPDALPVPRGMPGAAEQAQRMQQDAARCMGGQCKRETHNNPFFPLGSSKRRALFRLVFISFFHPPYTTEDPRRILQTFQSAAASPLLILEKCHP